MRLKDYTDLKMGFQLSRNVFRAKLHCHQYIVCFLKYRDSPHCNMSFVKETTHDPLFLFYYCKEVKRKKWNWNIIFLLGDVKFTFEHSFVPQRLIDQHLARANNGLCGIRSIWILHCALKNIRCLWIICPSDW